MSFVDTLVNYGTSNPEKLAIHLPDRAVTFGMVASGIRSVTSALLSSGIDRGQIIGVRIENQIRHLIVVCALYRLGIASVSLSGQEDPTNAGFKIDATISDGMQLPIRFGRPVTIKAEWFTLTVNPDNRIPGFASDGQLARIIMSSGTTGLPKAIGHTVKTVEDRITIGHQTLAIAQWDRMLCLPLLTSSLGFGSALQALSYGHSVLMAESPTDALEMIALHSVDLLVCNPQHLQAMVEAHNDMPVQTPSLKLIKYGGDSIPYDLALLVQKKFCKDILCVYSSTETGPIAMGDNSLILDNRGATGIIAPWVNVEILNTEDKPVTAGTEGRLRVKSPWQGYDLKIRPEATQDWVYTGDIGSISPNGVLSLVGRATDAIMIENTLVSPEAIERALYGFLGIDDVAALGMPGADNKQEIWLTIASQKGFDEARIRSFLAMKNPLWIIKRITIMPLIDRNKMGKIVRNKVRNRLLNN